MVTSKMMSEPCMVTLTFRSIQWDKSNWVTTVTAKSSYVSSVLMACGKNGSNIYAKQKKKMVKRYMERKECQIQTSVGLCRQTIKRDFCDQIMCQKSVTVLRNGVCASIIWGQPAPNSCKVKWRTNSLVF